MFLTNNEILQAVNNKEIRLDNFDPNRMQPASYDVLLDNDFKKFDSEINGQASDPCNKIRPKERSFKVLDGDPVYLYPGDYLLAQTFDFIGSEKYLIQISGKSSLARIGLMIHNTAGIVNPGHYCKIVLEISNQSNIPVILRPKMEIAQLLFSKLSSEPSLSYQSEFARDNWKVGKTN